MHGINEFLSCLVAKSHFSLLFGFFTYRRIIGIAERALQNRNHNKLITEEATITRLLRTTAQIRTKIPNANWGIALKTSKKHGDCESISSLTDHS